jgi:hypothetical protein
MDVPKAWRQIHLLSTFFKTLERIVLARFQEAVDDQLSPSMFGSRGHRGTADVAGLMDRWFRKARERKLLCSLVVADVEGVLIG